MYSGRGYSSGSNSIPCDNVHNGYNDDYGKPDASTPALKIYGDSCTKEDGTLVRKYCECNMDIFTYYYTGAVPRQLCIDPGPDGYNTTNTERINYHVYVCYFSSTAAKDVVCPNCKACSWANVSYGNHVSKSFSH